MDGTRLAGVVLEPLLPHPLPAGARPLTFVLAHGFTNHVARAPFVRLAGWLRRFGEVRALDFRGHGGSGGGSAGGGDPGMVHAAAAGAPPPRRGAPAAPGDGVAIGG